MPSRPEMKSLLLANLNWLIADKLIRLVGGLLVGAWVARYLGPAQFGLLNYAMAFVALAGAAAKLGMDQIVVRNLIRLPEEEGATLGTLTALKVLAAVLALGIVVTAAWLTRGGDVNLTLLVAIIGAGMLFNALDAYDLFYQSQLLSRHIVLARCTAFLLFALVRVALIMGEYPLMLFAVATTLEIGTGGILLAINHRRLYRGRSTWRFSATTMRSLLKDGWPLILSSVLIMIHTRIDQVMIGQMLGDVEVGIYSVAVRLSEAWLFVPLVIIQTVTPYLVRLRSTDVVRYHQRLMQLYSIMFWFGVAVGIAAVLLGQYLVIYLFGEPYRAAYIPLVLTIWTGIFISQTVARGVWMVGENLQGYRLINNLVAVPLNIALNWLLIPRFGVVGASAASVASIGLVSWVLPFIFTPLRASNWQMLCAINPKYLSISRAGE